MEKYLRTDLRYVNWWVSLAILALWTVLIAAWMPQGGVPFPVRWDKAVHGLSFLLLMILSCGPFVRNAHIPLLGGLFVVGLLIELVQIPLPDRREEWSDLLADCVGLVIGLVLVRFWLRDWCVWIERLLRLQ